MKNLAPTLLSINIAVSACLVQSCSSSNFSGAAASNKVAKPNTAQLEKNPDAEGETATGGGDITCMGTDVVKNGNFDSGNTEFTTEYGFESGCRVTKGKYTPGDAFKYTINTDPGKCHDGYYANVAGNTGNMLVVNLPVAGSGMHKFWCQKVAVTAGTTYEVSARMRTVAMSTQTSQSKWTINDTIFSQTFDPSGAWKIFTAKWKAETTAEVELCGKNIDQNTESGDLAVDDISFRVCR